MELMYALPAICEVWIEAERDGVLRQRNHIATAKKANALYKALARVGAVALVDEATGYQKERKGTLLLSYLKSSSLKKCVHGSVLILPTSLRSYAACEACLSRQICKGLDIFLTWLTI